MIRYFYTFLFYLILPLVLLRLWLKGKKNPGYRQAITERFGYAPFHCHDAIWLHAVSLGETVAAIPLLEELLKVYPNVPLVLTYTTATGRDKVRQHFAGRVLHCYFPYDLPGCWRRFFGRIRPKLILLMETELWPNLLTYAQQKKVPVMLINARLSDVSIKDYLHFKSLAKDMLSKIKIIAAQSALDVERFIALGASADKVIDVGNLKFDVQIADNLIARAESMRKQQASRPVWIAASTHPGEEMLLLKIHRAILTENPNVLLIIVPRHPERFEEVAKLILASGFSLMRKSSGHASQEHTQVFLGDSMGELQFYYALADVAFVGGSLVNIGGHNPLEALVLGKKVIVGPYIQNARMMYVNLINAGLVESFSDEALIKAAVLQAFNQPLDQAYVDAYMNKLQGVKGRIMQLIKSLV
jgi:3-deoxy-D-manno-octulosonic-acid transferase